MHRDTYFMSVTRVIITEKVKYVPGPTDLSIEEELKAHKDPENTKQRVLNAILDGSAEISTTVTRYLDMPVYDEDIT